MRISRFLTVSRSIPREEGVSAGRGVSTTPHPIACWDTPRPWTEWMTHACENNTRPYSKLRLRAVIEPRTWKLTPYSLSSHDSDVHSVKRSTQIPIKWVQKLICVGICTYAVWKPPHNSIFNCISIGLGVGQCEYNITHVACSHRVLQEKWFLQ